MKHRIVVCSSCGGLYDLHYINNVKTRKGEIYQFECKNCGMQDIVYKKFESLAEVRK